MTRTALALALTVLLSWAPGCGRRNVSAPGVKQGQERGTEKDHVPAQNPTTMARHDREGRNTDLLEISPTPFFDEDPPLKTDGLPDENFKIQDSQQTQDGLRAMTKIAEVEAEVTVSIQKELKKIRSGNPASATLAPPAPGFTGRHGPGGE